MVHKFPFTDACGIRYVGGVGVEITERVQTEERVRISEARFRAIMEGSMDAFFLLESVRDEAGVISGVYICRHEYQRRTSAPQTEAGGAGTGIV